MIYGAMKFSVGGPLKLAFRPWVEGLENIPAEGPAILASNHLSFSDSFFLPAVLDRKVTFIAKAEYFTSPGVKGKLTAAFFKGVGQLPVDRSGARGAGEAAIRSGIEVLERGELFGIYPEGTRSPDGRLYRGKPGGLARVALATGAPVIPVAMIDTEKIQPPGKVVPEADAPGHPDRQAAGLQPLPGHGARPLHPAGGDRRGHVRDHEALRPGVRRHLRDRRQAADRGGGEGREAGAEAGRAGREGAGREGGRAGSGRSRRADKAAGTERSGA